MIDASPDPGLTGRAPGGAHRLGGRGLAAAAQDTVRREPTATPSRRALRGRALRARRARGQAQPAGESALFAINRLFDEADALFGFLSELAGNRSPRCASPPATTWARGCCCRSFASSLPHKAPLRFEITTTHSLDAPRSVSRGEVDFAVITTLETNEDLTRKASLHAALSCGSGRVSKGDKSPLTRADSPRTPAYDWPRGARAGASRRLSRGARIRPASTIDVPSVRTHVSYASGGLGVGLAPALSLVGMPRTRIVDRARPPYKRSRSNSFTAATTG